MLIDFTYGSHTISFADESGNILPIVGLFGCYTADTLYSIRALGAPVFPKRVDIRMRVLLSDVCYTYTLRTSDRSVLKECLLADDSEVFSRTCGDALHVNASPLGAWIRECGTPALSAQLYEWLDMHTYSPALRIIAGALESGGLAIVENFGSDLHPTQAAYIVRMFQTPERNPKGAQLLFTSNATHLLNVLRREEVWFVHPLANSLRRAEILSGPPLEERWDRGVDIYSLSSFVQSDVGNEETRYLEGRYDAIPFLQNDLEIKQVRGDHDTDDMQLSGVCARLDGTTTTVTHLPTAELNRAEALRIVGFHVSKL